jgi:hypothetical protein
MMVRTPAPRPFLLLLLGAVTALAYGFQRSEESALVAGWCVRPGMVP